MSDQILLMPRGNAMCLCKVENGNILDLAKLPSHDSDGWSLHFPFVGETPARPGAYGAVDYVRRVEPSGWVVLVTRNMRGVIVARYQRDSQEVHHHDTIEFPTDCEIHSLSICDSTLLIGGGIQTAKGATPRLWTVPLKQTREVNEVPLKLPPRYISNIAAFDELIVDQTRNRLIGVDDIALPKYLFEFDLTDPLLPKQQRVVPIEPHGTYETICRGVWSSEWLALYSAFAGTHSSSHRCISLFSFDTLVERLSVYLPNDICRDIALVDQTVFIAGGNRGVGTIHLGQITNGQLDSEGASRMRAKIHGAAANDKSATEPKTVKGAYYYRTDLKGRLESVFPLEIEGEFLAVTRQDGVVNTHFLRCDLHAAADFLAGVVD